MNRPTLFQSLVGQCLAWIAVVLLYHTALQSWMAAGGGRIGAINPRMVVPLHASWAVTPPGAWALPALVVLAGVFVVRGRLFRDAQLSAGRFVALASVAFLCVASSLAVADGYSTRAAPPMFRFLVQHSKPWQESQGDVPYLERVGLKRFCAAYSDPRQFAKLANHTRSHPPGQVLFQWTVARIFGKGLAVPPLAELGFGALFVALTYLLGRELYGDVAARLGVALAMVAPNVVMFATSIELPFAVFLLLPVWLFVRAARRDEPWTAVLSGLAMAGAVFMTFATLMPIAVLALWFLVEWRREPQRRTRLLRVAVLGSLASWIAFGLLLWITGYDILRALPLQHARDARIMGKPAASLTRVLNLGLANLMAFLIGLGAPLVCLSLRALGRDGRRAATDRDTFLLAVAATVVLFAGSLIFTLEVERIWLFMTPLLAIGAGRTLDRANGAREFGTALGLSCILLWLTEAALVTAW